MKKAKFTEIVRLIVFTAVIAALLAALYFLFPDKFRSFIDFIRDRQAIQDFAEAIGIIGPLVVCLLLGIQIFIPWLPAEPTLLASAYLYGFWPSFIISWIITVAVSQLVYLIARWAGRPLVERVVPKPQLDKWSALAREKGITFFIFAFILPPIPTDMMIYVGGISGIGSWQFFIANLIGRMPLLLLYALVGGYGFELTSSLWIGLITGGFLLMALWWYLVLYRKRPDKGSQ